MSGDIQKSWADLIIVFSSGGSLVFSYHFLNNKENLEKVSRNPPQPFTNAINSSMKSLSRLDALRQMREKEK